MASIPKAPVLAAFLGGFGVAALLGAASPAEKLYPKLDVFAKVLSYVKNNYIEDIGDEKLIYASVKGMVGVLDPHSAFLEPKEYRSLKDDTRGEFGGVGLEIEVGEKGIVVVAPIDDTPAAKAGLKAGDVITAIDALSTKGMGTEEASGWLRGPPGTPVTIQLWRSGFTAAREIVLLRDRIRVVSVEAKYLRGKIGYVKIKSFQDRTDQLVRKELEKLRTQAGGKLSGLVLDMRNNPGGLLQEGVRVADRFISKGLLLTTKGRDGRSVEEEQAAERDTEPEYPIAVLVNGGTASASEVVAGALQDHDRAVLFGARTFGKGSVQTVIDLDDGSALKLTVSRYYTPSGRSIQETGIVPDVRVETPDEAEEGKRREVTLAGHLSNDAVAAERAPVALVDAIERVAPRADGDLPLAAAEAALADWATFRKRLEAARAKP